MGVTVFIALCFVQTKCLQAAAILHVLMHVVLFFPETPLTLSIALSREKSREMMIILVSGGAHLDFRNKQGLTPLHKAAGLGILENVKVLARVHLLEMIIIYINICITSSLTVN